MAITIIVLLTVCAFAAYFCMKEGGIRSGILQGKRRKAHAEPDDGGGEESKEEASVPDYSGKGTKDLLVEVLRQLNCNVENDEEESERMFFTYQGEHFCAVASNNSLMVTIYDFSWGAVELDDLDEVSILRKGINEVNMYSPLNLVYTIDTEHNRMVVHTKRQILLVPQIPNLENYLVAMLGTFFEVQRNLAAELDKLRK